MTLQAVLLISPTSNNAGSERALFGLARQLRDRRVNVEFLLFEPGPLLSWLEREGFRIHVSPLKSLRAPVAYVRAVFRAVQLARRCDADVIVSNLPSAHAVGGVAAMLTRCRSVMWQHGLAGDSRLERWVARLPVAFVGCVGPLGVTRHTAAGGGPIAFRWDPGTPVDAIRARMGCGWFLRSEDPPGRLRVGIVGRLQPWKGQETFVRAAALLRDQHDDVGFFVVGGALNSNDEPFATGLSHLADHLGLGNRISFVGDQSDPLVWLDSFDVVVHASREEPFGLVVVEAMALGKAIVAAKSGGPAEICSDGQSALLVRPDDVVGYAEAISRLLNDEDLRRRLGGVAAKDASRYDEQASTDRFEALLALDVHSKFKALKC